jgi:uncharacterized protein (TIGR02145 family)
MKKITTILFILAIAIATVMAQAPQQFKYQAALRDADGAIMANEAVIVDISILQGSTSGAQVFTESHNVTTTAQGIINLSIGSVADLSNVDWSADTYFIQIIVNGTVMGVSQLLSVPYAQYAEEAGNAFSGSYNDLSNVPANMDTDVTDDFSGDYNDLLNAPDLSDTINYKQELALNGMDLTISSGNTVTLPGSTSLVPVYTTAEIVSLTPDQGQAVFNSEEELYQLYDGTKWVSFNSNCWPQPTTADAGEDQIINDDATTTTLNANVPEPNHGTGQWSIVSGDGGSFSDATDPSAIFTGIECESYSLKWAISSSCGTSEDLTSVTFNQTPTIADAGEDQVFNDGTTTVTLSANAPEAGHGTGQWSIVSGVGGSFSDVTNPTASFTGAECETYSLRWTISTACSSSEDLTSVTFNQTPTIADAGDDQIVNDGTTTVTLNANAPETGHGVGQWSIVSGDGGSFSDAADPLTSFTGSINEDYILSWTITTSCGVSEDDVAIGLYSDVAGATVTDIDGNVYETVWIGGQNWMAENLKTNTYNDGTSIELIEDNTDWDNNTNGAYCWLDNNQTIGDIYGALYNWHAVNNSNLCPTGWHVPTDEEWTDLENYVAFDGHNGSEATALKSTSGWEGGGNGTDEYGFSALPGGNRESDGIFGASDDTGFLWSATGDGGSSAWSRQFFTGDSEIYRSQEEKTSGYSVRCIKD